MTARALPMLDVREHPSPHHGARPSGTVISGLILHADGGTTDAGTLSWCASPASKVSYHYLIGRTGTVWRLVPEARRAWHAGVSAAAGLTNCNDWTIGVAFANRQDGEPFPEAQIAAGIILLGDLRRRHAAITLDRVWTHEAVGRPEGRKSDPGPLFPLARVLRAIRQP